jgi:hypothetical protein
VLLEEGARDLNQTGNLALCLPFRFRAAGTSTFKKCQQVLCL